MKYAKILALPKGRAEVTNTVLYQRVAQMYERLAEKGVVEEPNFNAAIEPLKLVEVVYGPDAADELEETLEGLTKDARPAKGRVRGIEVVILLGARDRSNSKTVEGFSISLGYDPGFRIPGARDQNVQIELPKDERPHAFFYPPSTGVLDFMPRKANIGAGMLEGIVDRILDEVIAG